jgi:hypothetical protein
VQVVQHRSRAQGAHVVEGIDVLSVEVSDSVFAVLRLFFFDLPIFSLLKAS